MNHTSYLVNRSPLIVIDLQIAGDKWGGEFVDYSTLQIFSCPAYSLVNSQKRNKLESKSKSVSSSGSPKESRIFRLPETRSAFISRDVVFDEELML